MARNKQSAGENGKCKLRNISACAQSSLGFISLTPHTGVMTIYISSANCLTLVKALISAATISRAAFIIDALFIIV